MNPERNILYSLNRVKLHNRYESLEHFMTKAMLTHLLFKKGKNTISEAEMRDGRTVDTLLICKDGDLVAYEIESIKDTKPAVKGVDIVDIYLKAMPEEAKTGLLALEKWLEEFIV